MKDSKKGDGELLPRNVILVDSSSTSRKLFSQNIELFTGAKVHTMANADEVIDQINRKDNPTEFHLIISDNMVGDENTILKIFYTVNSQKLGIPIILLGKNPKVAADVTEIDKERWREVVKAAGKLMEVTAEDMAELEVPDYYPLSLYGVLFNFKTSHTIYLKNSSSEYTIWKKPGENISKSEVRELLFQGYRKLYLSKLIRLEFIEGLSINILHSLKSSDLSAIEKLNATSVAFDMTTQKLIESGFSKESLEQSKSVINAIVSVTASSDGLDVFLDILTEGNESYLYRHTMMICAVAQGCLTHLEWGNKNQIVCVCYAAFFHDLTIPEDHLCRVQSLEELNSSKLSTTDLDRIDKHALRASEIVKDFSQVPIGVDQIILQHHGSLNGVGISKERSLDNRLSPLAIVFIVVEEFVSQLIKKEGAKPLDIIQSLSSVYEKGKEKKVLEAIKKSFTGK